MSAPTQPKVRVTKPLASAPWRIDCTLCEGDWLFMFQPWAFAANYDAALTLALWHVELHREQTCATCGQIPKLPKARPLDSPGLFKLDEELYRLTATGVRKVVPA